MQIARMLLFAVTVVGSILGYLPALLIARSQPPESAGRLVRAAAVVAWLAGGAVIVWCIRDFWTLGKGTPAPNAATQRLVDRGLYRYSRNPLYVGALLVLGGHALWFQRRSLLFYAGAIVGLFHAVVVGYEEPELRARFGEPYARYCARVPRWLGIGRRSTAE